VKTTLLMTVVLLAGLSANDGRLLAHHGAAAYDMSTPVQLKNAKVTEFLWINPHPLIKADVTNDKGEVEHWTMEMGSTVSAGLVGWTRTTLGYGDVVPVPEWQLLGPMTAMNGILLFGWSTAVIFEVMRRAIANPAPSS